MHLQQDVNDEKLCIKKNLCNYINSSILWMIKYWILLLSFSEYLTFILNM